jgi:outer membrane receptor protein involved in Fe transport
MSYSNLPQFDRTSGAIAAALLCSIAQLAYGQAARPPAASASAPESVAEATVQRIIVTANKREQAAIDVPASVSAVAGERLTLGGAARIEDFAAQVPGLAIIEVTRGQTSVVLRGISTGASQATPSTAHYIDEAPVGSVNAYAFGGTLTPDLDPSDLQRVEVLKGPQGTLYGAGAVGGLLRYVTIAANADRFSGVVSVGGNKVSDGSYGSNERIALNIPLAKDSLGLRVSAFNRNEAGYIDNPRDGQADVNKANTRGGRIALDWKIDADWSIKTWALTQELKADGYGTEDVLAPNLTPLSRPLERVTYIPEPQDMSLDVANTTVKGRVGNFELVSSTTWQDSVSRTRQDASSANTDLLHVVFGVPGLGAEVDDLVKTGRWSQELRARSSAFGDKLDYDVGLFWTRENSTLSATSPSPFVMATGAPLPLPPLADDLIVSRYEEYSLFGNATYAVTPHFDLLAGARFSNDQQHFDQDYKPSLVTPVAVNVVQDVTKQNSSWMLGARYMAGPATAVYARVATGYRPGGPSALPPGILPGGKPSFEPDTLTSYELGFKSEFLGGKASIEAAVFAIDWRDIQIQTTAPTATLSYAYFVNGGSAKSKGAEATLIYVPMSGLTLRANGAYTDARLSSDAPSAGGLSGDEMPFTPKWSGSLGADYKFALASTPAWVGMTVNYTGERRSDFSQRKAVDVPSYKTLNINAGVDVDQMRFSLYVRNLANDRGINYAAPNGDQFTGLNPSGNPFVASIVQPRTIGMDVSYRW